MADWKLRHFTDNELLFDGVQSFRILQYFGIEPGITPGAFTPEDRSFAQALLVAAVDSSYHHRFVSVLFDVFYMKPVASVDNVYDMCKEFTKKAFENWFEHATLDDLKSADILDSVRATITWSARSIWTLRKLTSEVTY